jgi:leucyl aminopeptidase
MLMPACTTLFEAPLIKIETLKSKPSKIALAIHLVFDDAKLPAEATADGFKGQKEKSFYLPGQPRELWVGLGSAKEATLENFRRGAQTAARKARELKVEEALLSLPSGAHKDQAGAAAEGAWLGLYKYTQAKGKPSDPKKEKDPELKALWIQNAPAGSDAVISERRAVCEAVCLVRDLVNHGPSEKYPELYAKIVAGLVKGVPGLSLKVLHKAEIEKWPMAGLVAVNQGSKNPPVFVHLAYKPAKARKRVALVGKGVTFDSGGLSLKPAGSMLDMKCDMAGSATVIALTILAAKLKLPVEVHACAPITENMPGADAIKIGDIIRYKNGKTAEMLNTDAEGRVILADGLLFAETLKPDVILDFATLTGAAIVALGMNISAVLGDDKLCEKFKTLGERSGERFWQLPLPELYHAHIESKLADIKNIGNSGEAGTMAGAFYLKEFVTTKAWVHFDIAGPAFLKAEDGVSPAGGTGIPVRTVFDYLRSL